MANAQLMELVKKLVTNSKYQEEFAKCKTKQEMFDYCSSICSGYTQEEFNDFISEIVKNANSEKSVPVTTQNLKNVSGGRFSKGEYVIWQNSIEEVNDNVLLLNTFTKLFADNLKTDNVSDMLKGNIDSLKKIGY